MRVPKPNNRAPMKNVATSFFQPRLSVINSRTFKVGVEKEKERNRRVTRLFISIAIRIKYTNININIPSAIYARCKNV